MWFDVSILLYRIVLKKERGDLDILQFFFFFRGIFRFAPCNPGLFVL